MWIFIIFNETAQPQISAFLRRNGGKIRETKATLGTSKFPWDPHKRIARYDQVFEQQLMIYFQTGSERGENEAVYFSRIFSFVSSASATLTCAYSHSTAHTDQAACGMVRWMSGRPTLLFHTFFLSQDYLFICMNRNFNLWLNEITKKK